MSLPDPCQLSIRLSRLNGTGLVAEVVQHYEEDFEGEDDIEVARDIDTTDTKSICLSAARRLHTLANAFEYLALVEQPFREQVHKDALHQAVVRNSLEHEFAG